LHRWSLVSSQTRSAGPETRLDACAFAWLKLVRRPDIPLDRHGLFWLATVAAREAWRAKRECQEIPCGTFAPERDDELELRDPPDPASDPLDMAPAELHRERIARFARLKPRERRDPLLSAGGYKYHEIAAATGSTDIAVNRRITEGRAQLRRP
jgi:DNA-directed RNA polymerase specialized sigma24 family protein